MVSEEVEREAVLGWWGVAACAASAGVPARCGGAAWARVDAWAPSLVCGGFARRVFFCTKTHAAAPSPARTGGSCGKVATKKCAHKSREGGKCAHIRLLARWRGGEVAISSFLAFTLFTEMTASFSPVGPSLQ